MGSPRRPLLPSPTPSVTLFVQEVSHASVPKKMHKLSQVPIIHLIRLQNGLDAAPLLASTTYAPRAKDRSRDLVNFPIGNNTRFYHKKGNWSHARCWRNGDYVASSYSP